MKTDCNVIRDLLPLYADDVCSRESRSLVEDHLAECPACTRELENLRENEIEKHLEVEKGEVIRRQKKQVKRRSATAGTIIAGILLVPVVICMVINRFQGGLDWFFVVLASLGVVAAVTVVPCMAPENKLFWTFCAFCLSLVILLAVTCLYSGGNWFFVAASASLFGLSVVFLPFVIRAKPLQPYVPKHRALTVITVDIGLFAIMMECIKVHNRGLGLWDGTLLAGVLIGIAVYFVVPEMKKRGIIK